MYKQWLNNVLIIKFSMILTKIIWNWNYTITIHFHTHFQCLVAGILILPSVFFTSIMSSFKGMIIIIWEMRLKTSKISFSYYFLKGRMHLSNPPSTDSVDFFENLLRKDVTKHRMIILTIAIILCGSLVLLCYVFPWKKRSSKKIWDILNSCVVVVWIHGALYSVFLWHRSD